MAIQTGFQSEHTCTHDLSALAPAHQVAEGSKDCYPGMPPGREAEPILAERVDGVFKQKLKQEICAAELGAHPEPKDKILNELYEIVDVQKKKLDIQGRLITSLRERLDKSDTLSSLQQKKIDRLEETIDQLNKENLSQKESFEKEIVQLKARNSQQQGEIDQLKNKISQLSAENLLQKEGFEESIRQLRAENLKLKKEIDRLKAENSGLKGRVVESERRMAEQQEKTKIEHQKEIGQRLAESERRMAEQQEKTERRFAEFKEQMEIEHQEKMKRQKEQMEIKQEEKGVMHFGNLLLASFDGYSRGLSKTPLPAVNTFLHLINQKVDERYIYSTGGIFSALSNYCDPNAEIEAIVKAIQDIPVDCAYFNAVCNVIVEYPLFSYLPGKNVEEKVVELCRLVELCSRKRNIVAHQKDKETARKVIEFLVRGHGERWRAFIEEIVK